MANKTIEQKKLKMKRRGRFARFSGATTRFKPPGAGSDTIFVSEISLSKQVINTGRGPSAERMQEYYQRIHSYDQALPKTLGLTEPMRELKANYDRICSEMKEMRIRLMDDEFGSLDLFFEKTGHQWFFVEVSKTKKYLRRSTIYSSKKFALLHLDMEKITWVEKIPK